MKKLKILFALASLCFTSGLNAQDFMIYSNATSLLRGHETINLSTRIDIDRILLAAEVDYIYNLPDGTRMLNPNSINFGTNLKVGYKYKEIMDTELYGDMRFHTGLRLNHSFHNIYHRDIDLNGSNDSFIYHKRYKKVTPMGFIQGEADWDGFVIGMELAMGHYFIYDLDYNTIEIEERLHGGRSDFTRENGTHYFEKEGNQIVMQINISLGYKF